MRHWIAGVIAMAMGSGAVQAADAELAKGCGGNAPPPSWTLRQIEKASPPFFKAERPILLAWQMLEDDRPLRVESALVARHSEQGYLIEHLYRHPDEKPAKWNLSMTHVSPQDGDEPGHMIFHQELFDHRPKNAELYAALGFEKVNWSFEIEEGWRLVGGGVCEANWIALTGEMPAKSFTTAK